MKASLSESVISEGNINLQQIINLGDIITLVDWTQSRTQVSMDRFSKSHLYETPSYILECLAPIILSQKPAELLNIGLCKVAWEEFRESLNQITHIGLLDVRKINNRQQFLFYNKNVLNRKLNNPICQEFLRQMNYPQFSSLEIHLEHLIDRIRFRSFPHEIGLFLGYPLKDVLGFMGLVPLPYVKTQGWRVYGDERISDNWYKKYQLSRQFISNLAVSRSEAMS